MSEAFHLTTREFDAYLPERATSNAHSRPRMDVKERALAWARTVLARIGVQGAAVDVTPSDEVLSLRNGRRVDCQWILFRRPQSERDRVDVLIDRGRPMSELLSGSGWYRRHAFVAMRVDSASVQVGFGLYADARLDVDNLRAALDHDAGIVGHVASVLQQLPDQFTMALVEAGTDVPPDAARTPTGGVPLEAVRELLTRVADGERGLWIGWSVPRAVALEHADILGEQLADATLALVPVYQALAWSAEHDHLRLEERLEVLRRERDETHAEASAETARWTEQRRRDLERARESREGAAPALATLFKRPQPPAAAPPTAPIVEQAPDVEAPQLGAEPGPLAPEAGGRGGSSLEVGSRVRVYRGVFGGRQGVVAELDGRGGARVLFGLLSTRIDLTDLEPVVQTRPSLMSSHHRRPLAAKPPANQGDRGPAAPRKAR